MGIQGHIPCQSFIFPFAWRLAGRKTRIGNMGNISTYPLLRSRTTYTHLLIIFSIFKSTFWSHVLFQLLKQSRIWTNENSIFQLYHEEIQKLISRDSTLKGFVIFEIKSIVNTIFYNIYTTYSGKCCPKCSTNHLSKEIQNTQRYRYTPVKCNSKGHCRIKMSTTESRKTKNVNDRLRWRGREQSMLEMKWQYMEHDVFSNDSKWLIIVVNVPVASIWDIFRGTIN